MKMKNVYILAKNNYLQMKQEVDKSEVLLMVLRYSFRHNLSLSAITELFELLNYYSKHAFATAIFNCDGVPVFKGSKCFIWPIQIIVNELPPQIRLNNSILYGLWFGKSKPDMNVFLSPFVKDAKEKYCISGISCKILGEIRHIKLYFLTCCVDSVARPAMQGTIQFNGRYGCNWCLYPGENIQGIIKYTIKYPVPNLRTERETLEQMEQAIYNNVTIKGVKTSSCLINLPYFNIISGFVPDYMHCCLLGVARRLAEVWFTSLIPTSFLLRMEQSKAFIISSVLVRAQYIRSLKRPTRQYRRS
ncbi:uncharacterized protein LOC116849888 [Odontomachus brunneus]|uniref:uncharacterized protein LOC116849888 n=1 Tax=Odontomachus brunneus TaxID=486640 RepID=UPI0013F234A3|nr:uncharacterized protein LOC116849888 [Odontomachus brunneus]